MSWAFLVFVFCGPDSVWRYSELIEMVPVLYLYSILRRAFFLRVWSVCQFGVILWRFYGGSVMVSFGDPTCCSPLDLLEGSVGIPN